MQSPLKAFKTVTHTVIPMAMWYMSTETRNNPDSSQDRLRASPPTHTLSLCHSVSVSEKVRHSSASQNFEDTMKTDDITVAVSLKHLYTRMFLFMFYQPNGLVKLLVSHIGTNGADSSSR